MYTGYIFDIFANLIWTPIIAYFFFDLGVRNVQIKILEIFLSENPATLSGTGEQFIADRLR